MFSPVLAVAVEEHFVGLVEVGAEFAPVGGFRADVVFELAWVGLGWFEDRREVVVRMSPADAPFKFFY